MGGSATMQAGTRVNAEQASKRLTRKPTLLSSGEGRRPAGKRATKHRPVSAGVMASACMEDGKRSNTGSPAGAVHAATGTPRGAGRAGRVAERPVGLKTRGNARRGKGPQVWRDDGGTKACGSGFAYEPRVKGRRVPKHHMRKRRGRAEWRLGAVRA